MESESCEASTSLEVNNISGFETFDKYQQVCLCFVHLKSKKSEYKFQIRLDIFVIKCQIF